MFQRQKQNASTKKNHVDSERNVLMDQPMDPLSWPLFVWVVVGFILLVYFLVRRHRQRTFSLQGKHVVVTGGSSGIGKAIALKALQSGAKVTIMARKLETLVAAKTELENQVPGAEYVGIESVDCGSNEHVVAKAFSTAIKNAGSEVDVLVNCAGTSVPGVFEELNEAVFEQMMRVNYFGSVYPTRAVVPSMKKRGCGRIVFVSSQGGLVGIFGFSAYSPAKFAVVGLAQVLRMELKPHGIAVCVAYPPDTDTPGFENENKVKPDECRAISETSGLFKPEDVASDIVAGMEAGRFSIYTGLDGWMLSTLCAGMVPPSSFLEALSQGLLLSFLRVISMGYSAHFDGIAREGKRKREVATMTTKKLS